ncbi:hypothetical protein D3C81_2107400 [compost metagenome]
MMLVVNLHHGISGYRTEQHECAQHAVLGIDFPCLHHGQCAKQQDEDGDCRQPLGPKGKAAARRNCVSALADHDDVPRVEMDLAIRLYPL